MILDSLSSPSQPRIEKLLSIGNEFLSSVAQPVSSYASGSHVLLTPLVPGSHLRIRSLQLLLHCSWDQEDDSTIVLWDVSCLRNLEWWLVHSCLELGISLAQVSPDIDFWSDTSDLGWGVHLAEKVASGLWSPEELSLSINARELLAVERGLLQFCHLLAGSTVCGQFQNCGVSAQARRDSFSRRQLDCATDPPLGVVSPDCSCSPVHHGEEQCLSRFTVLAGLFSGRRLITGRNLRE